MSPFYAIENVGREVLLIRDKRIIGEGYSVSSSSGTISIEMRDERAKALISDSLAVKLWGERFPEKKFKYATFKFCQFTGAYLDASYYDPDMLCPTLSGVRVVDKMGLHYGIVPDAFKDVEGYNAIHAEIHGEG